MKKLLVNTSLVLLLLVSTNSTNAFASTPLVLIDQQLVESARPQIINNRTVVEFRPVFEGLDLNVTWDPQHRKVVGEKNDVRIELTIGSNKAIVSSIASNFSYDTEVTLDVPAQIVNGRTMVPLRFIAEATDAKVHWDNQNKVAHITSPPSKCKPFESDAPKIALEEVLQQKGYTVKIENEIEYFYKDGRTFYDMYYSLRGEKEHYIFIGGDPDLDQLEVAAAIAVTKGFPSTHQGLFDKFTERKRSYDIECNGVVYTLYQNNVGDIIFFWKEK
ncbi:copper amine oxidase N-terminal domain-containing protein [Alkaliphilus transvaalensis]|uniref:copper amine oxidase N-terminal domain-containing protein n=1 Tax=Alkaliphilus transvaalensis TaxID=114628 RepID=UPI000683E257|nr:copper amine oxidase N-terminal domain-containing protein [Alkaliphilus transvaalensis]